MIIIIIIITLLSQFCRALRFLVGELIGVELPLLDSQSNSKLVDPGNRGPKSSSPLTLGSRSSNLIELGSGIFKSFAPESIDTILSLSCLDPGV